MRSKSLRALVVASSLALALTGAAGAHGPDHESDDQHGGSTGHLAASSANVELVGKVQLTGVESGISDVSAHGNYAYLGAFRPECGHAGVHVVDISDPAAPTKVAYVPSHANVFVGEGVHVVHLETPAFTGDVLVHGNEPCDSAQPWRGGVSIWDVTNPASPQPLTLNFGDGTPAVANTSEHATHSVQAWTTGARAFVAMTDNNEAGGLDVDIVEITDPSNPVLIAETGFPHWATSGWEIGRGRTINHHDMQLKQIDGHWYLLASYWDAGTVLLNVDDPANPTFVGRNGWLPTDPLTGFSPVEGNAHQAYWSSDSRFILATDEDFSPYRLVAKVASGPFAGDEFDAQPARGIPQVTPDSPLAGPTVFVGRACSALPAAPSADAVALIERGDCTFQTKAQNSNAAGYSAGLVFNGNLPGQCDALVNMLVTSSTTPMLSIPRSAAYKLLGIAGYNPANCPGASNPPLPPAGTAGHDVDIRSLFDGWGYVRLIDAATLQETAQYAVPESLDESFATGFGNLTVHEVKTDPRPRSSLAYISYYDAGLRVVKFGKNGIREVGHYIAEGGNDFWGTFPHQLRPNERANGGAPYLLMSDRDSGLWIFRYTGE